MSAKRFLGDSGADQDDQPHEKRLKTQSPFASVIGEAAMVNSLHSLFSAMEPVLRRVVSEEVNRILRQLPCSFSCCPSQINIHQLAEQPSSFRLAFNTKLSLPIFTGSKISGCHDSPLKIQLLGSELDSPAAGFPHEKALVRVELVVIDGDFPGSTREDWTAEEFESNIIKERTGKRPLLTGDVKPTVKDGAAVIGDISFTDNSSWIRNRMFRIGARLAPGCLPGLRVKEAITEAFVVKDHRGELYKKHHPPMLDDEVWRLEKIGKEGVLHKKLAEEGVHTVQDFLRLLVVDPARLRRILGPGMSNKMWEATTKHARTCVLGNKLYIYRGADFVLYLNPICQLLKAVINGHVVYPCHDKTTINRSHIENLVRQAHANWKSLQEVQGIVNESPLLMTHAGQMVEHAFPNQLLMKTMEQGDGYVTEGHQNGAHHEDGGVWHVTSASFGSLVTEASQHPCN